MVSLPHLEVIGNDQNLSSKGALELPYLNLTNGNDLGEIKVRYEFNMSKSSGKEEP